MHTLSDFVMRRTPSRLFDFSGVFPSINITENKDNYFVRAELPGLKAEELDIQVDARTLSISGELTIASEGQNVRYHRRGRDAGKFSRSISLPGDIDSEHVEAKMENGLLTIRIPKSEATKPRQITVN
jgi:HSP20 family protein